MFLGEKTSENRHCLEEYELRALEGTGVGENDLLGIGGEGVGANAEEWKERREKGWWSETSSAGGTGTVVPVGCGQRPTGVGVQ